MKIILDFDNCIAQSNQAFIDIANAKTGSNARVEDIIDYHFDNIVPTWSRQQQNDVFVSKEFYDILKPFPNVRGVLQRLKNEGHEIFICSITRAEGMLYKQQWIRQNLGSCIDGTILVDNFKENDPSVKMDKSFLNSNIIIDDHINNLLTANVKYPILFGDNVYSKEWKGLVAKDWNEFYWLVQMISKAEK